MPVEVLAPQIYVPENWTPEIRTLGWAHDMVTRAEHSAAIRKEAVQQEFAELVNLIVNDKVWG